MKKIMLLSVMAVLFFLPVSATWASTIGFDPAVQEVIRGDSAFVNIYISGLGNASAPSLGTFDLDVTFDPDILVFSGVIFGDPDQGDQLDLLGYGPAYDSASNTGGINLFGLSFDSADALDAQQAESFILATLEFNTLSIGSSALGLSVNTLGDSQGNSVAADVQSGNVNVVPLPSTILLFGFGLVGLAGARQKSPDVARKR